MYTILPKSEGVPIQILFFWGDLTWNGPNINLLLNSRDLNENNDVKHNIIRGLIPQIWIILV